MMIVSKTMHIKESLYSYSKVVKRLNTPIDYKLLDRKARI